MQVTLGGGAEPETGMPKTRKTRESSRTRSKQHMPVTHQTAWFGLDFTVWMLVVVVALAAGLRLHRLDTLPPGLHTDEAANAWNAYCLLKTGTNQQGFRWPVSYLRAFGDNRSTLYVYLLLPFQALGGLNVWTTRLPGAVGGVVTVLLLYWIGTRLADSTVGLTAAVLLAVNPWHLQQCRWGHEASIVPLLIVLPMACMVWAGLPPFSSSSARPRPVIAALGGVLAGAGCYGYPAVRFFWPGFLLLSVIANWREWRAAIRAQRRKTVAVFLLSFLLIFLPLVWKHAKDDAINKRAQTNWVWSEEDSFTQKAFKAARRFPGHFGPDFLFVHGDPDIALSPPPGVGLFLWDSLVWMAFGAAFLIRTAKSFPTSRWLAVWLLSYPAGDLLTRHAGLHALRSLPGVCALVLLSAIGVSIGGKWVWSRFARQGPLVAVSIGVAIAALHLFFLTNFFTGLEVLPRQAKGDVHGGSSRSQPLDETSSGICGRGFLYVVQHESSVHLHSNWQRV